MDEKSFSKVFPGHRLCISFLGKYTNTIYIGQAAGYLIFKKLVKMGESRTAVELYGIAFILSVLVVVIFGNKFWSQLLQNGIKFMRQKVFFSNSNNLTVEKG